MPKIIAQATDPILIYSETKLAINTIKLISKNPGILFLKNLIRKFKVQTFPHFIFAGTAISNFLG